MPQNKHEPKGKYFMSGKLQNNILYACLGFMAYCSNFFIKI